MTQIVSLRPVETVHAAIEAEQMVLGAALLRQSVIADIGAKGGASLFADPMHAKVFEAAEAKDRIGELVSPAALAPTLSEVLREIGGTPYLARLASAAPASPAVPQYIAILEEMRNKRRLAEAMSEARAGLTDRPAAEVAAKLEAALVAIQPADGDAGIVSMRSATMKALKQIRAAYVGDDDGSVRSGIMALDSIIGGFCPGELTLIGGRPSMGKTALALQIALNAARAGHGVAIASLEMNPEAMTIRALAEAMSNAGTGVSYASMRKGDLTEHQAGELRRVATQVRELPIVYLSRQYADLGALFAGAKQAKRMLGDKMRLLVIDYLQLLRSSAKSRYEQITEISIAMKILAGQLNVPVIALSQLSRDLEKRDDKRPQLSDLRESGQLEQDADSVLFCYRDEYYLEREKPSDTDDMGAMADWQAAYDRQKNRMEIIVAKQRQGEIGTARVRFNPALNVVWEDDR